MFWPVACFVILRPLLPRQQFLFQVQASEFYVKTFRNCTPTPKLFVLCRCRSAFEVWVSVKRTSECSNLKDRRWHRLNVKQTSLTQKGISLAFSSPPSCECQVRRQCTRMIMCHVLIAGSQAMEILCHCCNPVTSFYSCRKLKQFFQSLCVFSAFAVVCQTIIGHDFVFWAFWPFWHCLWYSLTIFD